MKNAKPNPSLIQEMMQGQMNIVKKHDAIGSTCFIALDKKDDDIVYLVPCINQKDDIKKLAEKLQLSAQRLFILAEKIDLGPDLKDSIH